MIDFNLKKTIQYLLYALAMTPAIVFSNFLFPYISTRTVYFRAVVEVILIIFILLLWQHRVKLRERRNYFLVVFGLFVGVNIISSFFSFSFLIAWFSDIERMWGVFTLLHLFLFYLFLRVFFSGKEWRLFLHISLAVSFYVAVYGIIQHYPDFFGITLFSSGPGRIISTLGNSAYLAIYLVFNIFFAIFLFLKTDKKFLKYIYIIVIAVNAVAFNLTGTRGTIIGLLAGITVSILLYIVLGKNKVYKFTAAAILIGFSIVIFWAMLNQNSVIARNSELLSRISSISLTGGSIDTRLIGWRAAWEGFKEYPVLGVGMDNYNTIFNKYFDAQYYLFAPNEPYFDRSHNAWLDLLVMNGAVGFIIFLGFPFFIFYYLIKGYQRQKIKLDEFLLFSALSITYFVHLIFVFDDLNSYAYFVVLVAFVEYRYYKETIVDIDEEKKQKKDLAFGVFVTVAILITLAAMYNFNIKVALACNKVIDALQNNNDAEKIVEDFNAALAYNIVPSRNVTLAYVNYFIQNSGSLRSAINDPQRAELINKMFQTTADALEKEIKKDKHNAMLYNRRAVLNNVALVLFNDAKNVQLSLDDSSKAIDLSREHLQYYYTLADSYLIIGNGEKAIETIKESIKINNQYNAGYANLMRVYLAVGDLDNALSAGKMVVLQKYTAGGTDLFANLAKQFQDKGALAKELETLELAFTLDKKNADIASQLIKLYLEAKDNNKAIVVAEALKQANEELAQQAEYLIAEIKAGRGADILKQMEGAQ